MANKIKSTKMPFDLGYIITIEETLNFCVIYNFNGNIAKCSSNTVMNMKIKYIVERPNMNVVGNFYPF